MNYVRKLFNEVYTGDEIKEDYHIPKYAGSEFVPKSEIEQFISNIDSDIYDILTDLEKIEGLVEIDEIRNKVQIIYEQIN